MASNFAGDSKSTVAKLAAKVSAGDKETQFLLQKMQSLYEWTRLSKCLSLPRKKKKILVIVHKSDYPVCR